MNKSLLSVSAVAASALTASHAFGQTSEDQTSSRIELPKSNLNQFRVSCRLGFNISAHIDQLGGASTPMLLGRPIPESVTGVTYQDGFVGRDISGNFGGLTWYWGYADAKQVFGDNLFLSSVNSGALAGDFKNDPQVGLEVGYARQLDDRNGQKWGIEAAFTYTDLDLRSGGIADPRVVGVDAFPLGGITPPLAPYYGSFDRPAALIGDTPTHYPVEIVSHFDASIYGLKLGPYFEYPLGERVSFTVSGGFALLIADTNFRIQQSVSATPLFSSGTVSGSDLAVMPGAYVAGRLSLAVSDSANVFTGLQYESTGHHVQTLGDKRAEIDFWNAVYWTFGFSYAF